MRFFHCRSRRASLVQGGAPGLEQFGGNGQTGPVTDKGLLGQSLVMFLQGLGLAQRGQQVERGVLVNIVAEFHREVLDIGDEERALAGGRGEDLLGQTEPFLGGGTQVARNATWKIRDRGTLTCPCRDK